MFEGDLVGERLQLSTGCCQHHTAETANDVRAKKHMQKPNDSCVGEDPSGFCHCLSFRTYALVTAHEETLYFRQG